VRAGVDVTLAVAVAVARWDPAGNAIACVRACVRAWWPGGRGGARATGTGTGWLVDHHRTR